MRRPTEGPIVEGIVPALLTPFDDRGSVDEQALRRYVDHLLPRVNGLFVCGSYGSGPLMTVQQRMTVASVVTDAVAGQVPVLLHVGAADTATAIELTRHALDVGVDAVAAVTPYYYRHGTAEVESYYRSLIETTSLPVLAYNNPKYSNFGLTPEVVAGLAEHGLAGMKDSSGDISLFYSFRAAIDYPGFTFLIGSQTLLLPALVMGGHGCVSGLANVFPELLSDLLGAWRRGDIAVAAGLQGRANALRKLTGAGIPVPFYHAVLPLYGVDIGSPRAPFQSLSEGRVDEIRSELTRLGMLPARDEAKSMR